MSGILLQNVVFVNNNKTADVVGTAITNTAKKRQEIQNKQRSSSSNQSSSQSGGNSTDTSTSEDTKKQKEEEKKKKAEAKKFYKITSKMKDSNVGYYRKTNYNDFWNQATVQKQSSQWEPKEEFFLYTFHDKKKHRYLMSFNIDCDKSDILGTCQIDFPYDQRLMEYWIPGKTTFALIGGTYDREVLFVGRVGEINQRGQQIEMIGHNVGWKFKAYTTEKFEKSLVGKRVKDVVKMIFRQLGFTKGKYHIDLSGIPGLNKYVLDEDMVVKKGGEQVLNVPELSDVVGNINTYNVNKYIAKKADTRETQEVANDYNKRVNMATLDRVSDATQYYYPAAIRQNIGIETSDKMEYTPIMQSIQGTQDLEDYLVKGYSGDGENTYEDILNNIATAIDAHFFIVDTTACFMSFNAMFANSSMVQKAVLPTIDFWQLQDTSYDLNINQYGFYNTVHVKYKNGTITKSFEDLVRVYGEMAITYDEHNLDYDTAMLKADAYLAAHVRDFGMEIKATILYSGKYNLCNFVKMKNPLTMSESIFFIHGISIQWSADGQLFLGDLDLRFGPENPDGLEVPEVGTSYTASSGSSSGTKASGNVSASVEKAAQEMIAGCTTDDDKAYAIYDWVDKYVRYEFYWAHKYSDTEILRKKRANCYDTAYLIYRLCTAVGVKCEVHSGTYHFLDGNVAHLWNKIYYKGKMTFADTGRDNRNKLGQHGAGRYIISDSCVAKNY